jgi:hypothetical protein
MKLDMWVGTIGGSPRVVRVTEDQAIKDARELGRQYNMPGDIRATMIDVEI